MGLGLGLGLGLGFGLGFGFGFGLIIVTTVALAALPLLLSGVGSSVAEALLAILVRVPDAGNGKVTLRVILAPFVKSGENQVIFPVIGSYTPPSDGTTPVKPLGKVSVITTPVAVDGPLFVVVIV